jgi:hypothetical protein
MAAGRPTKYKAEFCNLVIELMKDGASKAECCVDMGITPQTFIEWAKDKEEFSEAVKQGELASKAWWEKKGRSATFGGEEGFNATSFIFNMKNRFKNNDDFGDNWADMRENKLSGNVGLTDLSDEELDRKLKQLANDDA